MNILIDLVPKEVDIDGKLYPINACFRTCILFEELLQDEFFTEEEKGFMALELFYPEVPYNNIEEAVNKILWLYKGNPLELEKEFKETEEEEEEEVEENTKAEVFSYKYDSEYIYSAFLSQYGIDLQDIEYLHWWKFKALFKSLKSDNKLMEIIGIRSIKIDKDMSKKEKKYYRKMKKIYALPDNRSKEEKEEEFHKTMSSII